MYLFLLPRLALSIPPYFLVSSIGSERNAYFLTDTCAKDVVVCPQFFRFFVPPYQNDGTLKSSTSLLGPLLPLKSEGRDTIIPLPARQRRRQFWHNYWENRERRGPFHSSSSSSSSPLKLRSFSWEKRRSVEDDVPWMLLKFYPPNDDDGTHCEFSLFITSYIFLCRTK